MKKVYRLYLCLISLLFGFVSNISATGDLNSRFDNYTIREGLSNNIVQCITQDSYGYIWVGTSQGLNRFDGYGFTSFRSLEYAKKRIKGVLIRCIFEDSRKQLWIGTENGGLFKFNRDKETFQYIELMNENDGRYSANTIIEDKNGKIWVGTNEGLAFLNKSDELEYYHFKSDDFNGLVQLKKCCLDSLNRMWIGTGEDGVFIFDIEDEDLTKVKFEGLENDAEVRAIYHSRDNILWIGTYENGVYTLDTRKSTNILAKQFTDLPTTGGLATIKALTEDKYGHLWVGTREGLICYDKVSRKYNISTHDVHNNISLAQNSVIDLFVDNHSDLWVGTRGGLSYRNKEKQNFLLLQESKNDNKYLNCAQVYAFYEASPNEVWIGTESGGINIYNSDTKTFTYMTKENSGLSTNCIKSMVEVDGKLLVGTYMGGLNVIDVKSRSVIAKYKHDAKNNCSIADNNVWDICITKDKSVLLATSNGIDKFDVKRGTFSHIDKLAYKKEVYYLFEDKDEDLWVFTPDEIIVRQVEENRTLNYIEKSRSVVQGNNNIYYVGSNERGILLYSKYNGYISSIDESNGLCNNNVVSMVIQDGKIYAGTTGGLSIIDISSDSVSITNFDERDGLQGNQFHYGAMSLKKNGEVMLGGSAGANIFDARLIKANDFVPPVLISEVKVFNQILPNDEIKEENGRKHISVDYDKNMISFKFAALSYSKSIKNEYRYRLKGGNWIEAGTENKCTFTNLAPGDYTFQVMGSNCDGVWNEKCEEIDITVLPPFWNTWWFRLLLLVAICTAAFIGVSQYLRRIKLKTELDLEKKKADEMAKVEKLKIDFFTNISHELRTPITLIIGPLSKILSDESTSSETRQMAELAQKNANQLLVLVNQVLDFRKIESGTLSVVMKEGDLVAFIQSIFRSFLPNAESRNISMEYVLDTKQTEVLKSVQFDGDKLEKILNNLLSNSLKFTPQGGRVSVSLLSFVQHKFNNGSVCNAYQIRVKDSGRGISDEDQKHIFERFYQSKGVDAHIGTGIGLSLVNDFVQMMSGDIEIVSQEGHGSEFIITLPAYSSKSLETQSEVVESIIEKSFSSNTQDEEKPILLIVEDNDELRKFCVSHFSRKFDVLEATNGVEAMKLAEENVPDIIVTDLLMPQMCGDELCKKIKQDERTSHIPLILLTAIHSKETEYDALKCGADDFVTKPFDIDILQQKMENIIALKASIKKKFRIEQISEPKKVETQSPDEKFMLKAMQVIEKNISEPDFDIEQLALETGVSRMQLYRKMNALTGMTVKEFIRNVRIKRAKQLLEQGTLTVSEIAYEVGFKDIAYFRKCFKAHFGVNPSEVK